MKTRVSPPPPSPRQPALPTRSFWMYTLTVTSTLCSRYKHRENKLPSNSSSPAPLRPALLQPLPPSPPSPPSNHPSVFSAPATPHGGLASVDLLWISQECGFIRGASNALFISKVARRASIETCCEPAAQKKEKNNKKKQTGRLDKGWGGLSQQRPPANAWTTPPPNPTPLGGYNWPSSFKAASQNT